MVRREILGLILLVVFSCAQVGWAFVAPPPESIMPSEGGLDKETFCNVLEDISGCLDEDRSDHISDLLTYDFLHSITNIEFQPLALPYTRKWAAEYGDRFPESFLLHSLAGGDVAVFTNQYVSLTNLVSRNCIRWCLMVNGIPLKEPPVKSRQGKYFKFDSEIWSAEPGLLYDGNRFSKSFICKSRSLIPPLRQVVGESVLVCRDDGVPVPWGRSMYPDMDKYPYIAPERWLGRRSATSCIDTTRPAHRAGYVTSSPPFVGVNVGTNVWRSATSNRGWNFFVMVNSPFVSISGQPIAPSSNNQLKGQFHYLRRILIAKNGFAIHPMENVKQDLIISPPIDFKIMLENSVPKVNFSWPGETVDMERVSFEEAMKGARKRTTKIYLRRLIIKGMTGVILLAGLILLLKKRGVSLSADEKKQERIGVIAAGLAAAPVIGIILFNIVVGLYSAYIDTLGSTLILILMGILIFLAPLMGMILGVKGFRQKAFSRKLPILAVILNAGWLVVAFYWIGIILLGGALS